MPMTIAAKREEIEARNKGDSTVYQVEKALNENRSKLSESDVKGCRSGPCRREEGAGRRRRRAHQQGDGCPQPGVQQGVRVDVQIGRRSLAAAAAGGNSSAGLPSGGAKPDGDVIDAEYVDGEEKK